MASNLRAGPIEGYVADSAGNVLSNSNIVVKMPTPAGSIQIDTVVSDDYGYFVTGPIQNGIYDIYESGVRISRIKHSPSQFVTPTFEASSANIPNNLPVFTQMDLSIANDINKFRHYLQVEGDDLDVNANGHFFPLYEPSIYEAPWDDFYTYHELTADSRITQTRFDVEYYSPITASFSSFRHMRWAGVPAIRYGTETKIVVPLDYYSLRVKLPTHLYTGSTTPVITNPTYQIKVMSGPNDTLYIYDDENAGVDAAFVDLGQYLVKGDILQFKFDYDLDHIYYGIYVDADQYDDGGGLKTRYRTKLWRSSVFTSTSIATIVATNTDVIEIRKYDGMFSGITGLGVSANEKFTITENSKQQNEVAELYDYTDS